MKLRSLVENVHREASLASFKVTRGGVFKDEDGVASYEFTAEREVGGDRSTEIFDKFTAIVRGTEQTNLPKMAALQRAVDANEIYASARRVRFFIFDEAIDVEAALAELINAVNASKPTGIDAGAFNVSVEKVADYNLENFGSTGKKYDCVEIDVDSDHDYADEAQRLLLELNSLYMVYLNQRLPTKYDFLKEIFDRAIGYDVWEHHRDRPLGYAEATDTFTGGSSRLDYFRLVFPLDDVPTVTDVHRMLRLFVEARGHYEAS